MLARITKESLSLHQCLLYSSFFKNKKELREGWGVIVYETCRKQGWLETVTQHMIKETKSFLSKEECIALAKKVQDARSFSRFFPKAYDDARRGGFISEVKNNFNSQGLTYQELEYQEFLQAREYKEELRFRKEEALRVIKDCIEM